MSIRDQRFLSLTDLATLPEPRWMIEGLFEENTRVMLAGPSYSFKSFMALDWMLCMASGRQWQGRVTKTSRIAYILGEGKSGLLKRIRAWIVYNKLTTAERELLEKNFKITFDVPQLADEESVDKLLEDLKNEEFRPDVIVVDTFARSAVGMDENEQKDMGLWIASADRLGLLGYTVLFLHHTKKNIEGGVQYRGSTAIMGAMDSAMLLVREGENVTLSVTKQKDHDEGKPMHFRRHIVKITDRKDDDSIVLISSGRVAEDAPETTVVDGTVEDLINTIAADPRFGSDRARARELARILGITEDAAMSRLRRVKTAVSS